MIKINTKPYGEMEIEDDEVLYFPQGILAFEEYKKYTIITDNQESPFYWLQNLEDPGLAFLIINPLTLMAEYEPQILNSDIEIIFGDDVPEDVTPWCIITIPKDKPEDMTMNLQGPLLISIDKKIGGQFVSDNDTHSLRTPVLELMEAGEIA